MKRPLCLAGLLALLPAIAFAAPDIDDGETGFGDVLRQRLHEHDRDAMDGWEAQLRSALQDVFDAGADAETEAGIAAMRGLLDVPRLPIDHDQEPVGRCRVRSLQVDRLGAYAYPWFDCELSAEARAIVFHKPTGSQRRFGLLGRLDPERYLFIGAMYFSGETPRGYSSESSDEPSPLERERDVVGHLFRIDPGHYVIAFAAKSGRHELYDLKLTR